MCIISVLESHGMGAEFLRTFEDFDEYQFDEISALWDREVFGGVPVIYMENAQKMCKKHFAGGYLNYLLGNKGSFGITQKQDFIFSEHLISNLNKEKGLYWNGGIIETTDSIRKIISIFIRDKKGIELIKKCLSYFKDTDQWDSATGDIEYCIQNM